MHKKQKLEEILIERLSNKSWQEIIENNNFKLSTRILNEFKDKIDFIEICKYHFINMFYLIKYLDYFTNDVIDSLFNNFNFSSNSEYIDYIVCNKYKIFNEKNWISAINNNYFCSVESIQEYKQCLSDKCWEALCLRFGYSKQFEIFYQSYFNDTCKTIISSMKI